jgi:hypothetical protein
MGRGAQQLLRHAEPFGDIQRAALSGFTQLKAVKRQQALLVEGHPGIDDPRLFRRVFLDFGVMGRHNKQAALLYKLIQYRHRQPHPSAGSVPGAQLIQQNKGFVISLI